MPGGEDDIIPTAIVIKNIPFSVKRETLLEIIVRVYYHFVSWYQSALNYALPNHVFSLRDFRRDFHFGSLDRHHFRSPRRMRSIITSMRKALSGASHLQIFASLRMLMR